MTNRKEIDVVKQQESNEGGITGKGFKKGKSGNPKGRPRKEHCISDMLDNLLKEKSETNPDISRMENICLKAIELAEGGDTHARNWVSDRKEGKALERIITKETDDVLEIR